MALWDKIPGYRQAVAAETVGRDPAYLRLASSVAGVVVRPLNLRDYLRLSAENSPFVAGGKAGKEHAIALLWHQRVDPREETERQTFARRFDPLDTGLLVAACEEYLSPALMDAPAGGGNGKGGYYGLGALLVGTFRCEYPGMSKEEVLSTPLDELWQEYRFLVQRRNPRAVLFNRSDRIKGEWLKGLNQAGEAAPKPGRKRTRRSR